MAQETAEYFSKFSSSISLQNRQQWEHEIKNAESSQLRNPAAMDILGICETPHAEQSVPTSERNAQTSVEEWIQMAIDLEEKQ
jgi:hypothetical protein